jgi:hypothetical protein
MFLCLTHTHTQLVMTLRRNNKQFFTHYFNVFGRVVLTYF